MGFQFACKYSWSAALRCLHNFAPAMDVQIFKALHILFVVTWFAGLFYIFRLFIYHTEALSKPDPDRRILTDQFELMARRLWYIITWPSAVLALGFGFLMLFSEWSFMWSLPFMQVKLFFVAILFGYQLLGQRIMNNLKKGNTRFNSFQLRLLNEVATVLLISIVFIIVLKDALSWIWGVVGILGIASLLAFSASRYRKWREAQNKK